MNGQTIIRHEAVLVRGSLLIAIMILANAKMNTCHGVTLGLVT